MTDNVTEPTNNWYWVPVEEIEFLSGYPSGTLQGGRRSRLLIQANSEAEAATELSRSPRYAENWNGASSEERREAGSPFRFREGPIEKILSCDKRYINRRRDLTCGQPLHDLEGECGHDDDSINSNGLYGMCCVEGYDVPDNIGCPYAEKSIKEEILFSRSGVTVTIKED
ncbi:MAG: hypothetical protein ABIF88_02510 [archaeon]